jgi:putative transposase
MKRTRHSAEQIVSKLREADAMLAAGRSVAQIVQALGVSEPTYARWRSQYGGMKADEARRLKELELENARLKRLVADQAIDISILKEANDFLGKHRAPVGGGQEGRRETCARSTEAAERRVCRVLEQPRFTQRHASPTHPQKRVLERRLVQRMHELVRRHPRRG